MRIHRIVLGLTAGLLLLLPFTARANTSSEAYRAIGIEPAKVLTGTVLNSRVIPGESKQVVSVTTYFTGKNERAAAVNVRLDVFRRVGEELATLFTHDLGQVNGGNVGYGDLQLIDLDMDGVNEIIVSYDSFEDPLIEQRHSEIITYREGSFRTVWTGPVKYDATRAARDVPRERRDRFLREFDIGNTLRTRGVTLFVNKTMIAVAGERLAEPKTVQETFPLQ